ncbi:hypothetical protein [Limnohabitans sp. DM1]|uniref:hypothetical protein n=1 Tax=Limnohabitans sp. DM1 TaxID=1597955 RepID=UPI000B802BBB|nr:hypothetical protein [Limnohabitans sp. DM1]
MKLNQTHIFLTPSFSEWPVSEVHRQPIYTLIDGIVKVLESLGLEGSQTEVVSFLNMLPQTPRSTQLMLDARAYLKARQQKVDELSEKQKQLVMNSAAQK